jgi:ABC-type multidrug transport system fused ATPase/permease subunit
LPIRWLFLSFSLLTCASNCVCETKFINFWQLYWNLMDSAYHSLQGLVTQFTRSAAGAEKVFTMWDSDPDIDPKKGNDVSWQVEGHLKLQDVSFFYQMRPDNIVLNKFNLEVPAGKSLALVGRSGGG